jgi:uncharacterized membrane protein YkoI
MKRHRRARRFASMIVAIAVSASAVSAAERKVQMKDLPPAVRTAVEAETQGTTLVGLSREKEHGRTVYEAETRQNGRTRDVTFDAAGRIVSVEQQIALDEAPAPVQAALRALGTVVLLETVTKGSTVYYEAQVEKKGRRSEVAVDANGKRIKA